MSDQNALPIDDRQASDRTGALNHWPQLRARLRRIAHNSRAALQHWAAAERAPLLLWAPVLFGVGVGVYFGLKSEPDIWVSSVAGVLALGLAAPLGKFRTARFALAIVLLGFFAADWRAMRVAAPVLSEDLGIVDVQGRVLSVENQARQQRFIIELSAVEGLSPAALPAKARISWRGDRAVVLPGETVTLRAGLRPPPAPAAPHGYDFARRLYFEKIGATGFAVSAPIAVPRLTGQPTPLAQRVELFRKAVFERIVAAAPGEGGAIVAAFVTGKRDAISQQAEDDLRDTGLAHLLAISGLHMALATGFVFFSVRLALASAPALALRFPIKKWAAGAALFAGAFYLILSGGAWSARRAFIMAAIMLIAVLVDRRAFSLRNVAIAALIILATTPEALFHAGFQMSFAATVALVAWFEQAFSRAKVDRDAGALSRAKQYGVGIAMTDLICATATAPYALYHFNRVAIYSLPANLIAAPLMAFWIMPVATLALLLAPIGLDKFVWPIAANGVDVILANAGQIASWPGAVGFTVQWPLGALLFITAGGLITCLLRTPLRLAGLAGVAIGALLISAQQAPDLMVADSGRQSGLLIDTADGEKRYALFDRRRDGFSARVWSEMAGLDSPEARAQLISESGAQCDASGCVADINGKRVSFLTERSALAEDCARADLVIAFFYASPSAWRNCQARLIDRVGADRRGAHAVWIDSDIRIETVLDARGSRPWTGP
ncbi:MAG: ComEC/Rec2 family competence protein [Pseudomonadota bacterium]